MKKKAPELFEHTMELAAVRHDPPSWWYEDAQLPHKAARLLWGHTVMIIQLENRLI